MNIKWATWFIGLLGILGCAQENGTDDQSAALIAMSESYHAQADLALKSGKPQEAQRKLQACIQFLSKVEPSREQRRLILDAYGRLAGLEWKEGNPEHALQIIEQGMKWQGPTPLLFGGYLYQLKGDILAEQGRDLEAIQAHAQAIKIFQKILNH